jgi:hypothetical protein
MKKILSQSLLDNLATANIAWPAMVLLYIPRYLALRRPGPSLVTPPKIAILHDVTAAPSDKALWRSVLVAVLIGVGICGLYMGFDRHGDTSERAVGWVCVGISVAMFAGLIWLARRQPRKKW